MTTNHFRHFAKLLEYSLEQYEKNESQSRLELQRSQLKTLISLEKKFRRALIDHQHGPDVYLKFIDYITNVKRNILAARPYFRERQTVFTETISGALKKCRPKTLYRFRINYTFVQFVLDCREWEPDCKLMDLARQIESVRKQLCEENMPLAISQARVFYATTPRSHLTWMDLVQIHAGGLMVAIDKFVPPTTASMSDEASLAAYRTFRAVAIGRMISDRIEAYSETPLHFYPNDRKKIYRANKILRSFGDNVNFELLAEMVNVGIENESHQTTASEISYLLAGASCVSGDTTMTTGHEPTGTTLLDNCIESDEIRHDTIIENNEAMAQMRLAISQLPLYQQKVIRLKGVSVW